MFHYSILNLCLTCSSFLSSFRLTVFIIFFLTQKSKSSTKLNHRKWKQEEATINQSTTICDSWGKNISGVIYPWDNFLGGGGQGAVFLAAIYLRVNYVDDKSPETQFSLAVIFRGILSGANYLWSNCPGAVIRGQSSRGQLSGGGGEYSSETIVWGTIIQGIIFLGSNCPRNLLLVILGDNPFKNL